MLSQNPLPPGICLWSGSWKMPPTQSLLGPASWEASPPAGLRWLPMSWMLLGELHSTLAAHGC